MVSLNEKQRGFPTGLRVMESDKYRDTLLYMDSSLGKVKFLDSDLMSVRMIEVWGCGGAEAAESQRRVKEWEQKEILRRRLVGSCVHACACVCVCVCVCVCGGCIVAGRARAMANGLMYVGLSSPQPIPPPTPPHLPTRFSQIASIIKLQVYIYTTSLTSFNNYMSLYSCAIYIRISCMCRHGYRL